MDVQHTPVVRLEQMNFDKSPEMKFPERTFDVSEADGFSGERRGSNSGNSKKRVSFNTHSSIRYFTEHSGILHSAELNDASADTSCAETFDIPSSDVRILDPEIDSEEKQSLYLKDVVIPLKKLPADLLNQVRSDDHHFDDRQNITKCPNPQGGASPNPTKLKTPPNKYKERERAESVLFDDDPNPIKGVCLDDHQNLTKCPNPEGGASPNPTKLKTPHNRYEAPTMMAPPNNSEERKLPESDVDPKLKCQTLVAKPISSNLFPLRDLRVLLQRLPNNMLDIRRNKMLNNVLDIQRKKMPNNVLDKHWKKMRNNVLDKHWKKMSNNVLDNKMPNNVLDICRNKNNSMSSKDCSDVCLEFTKENTSTTVECDADKSSFSSPDDKRLEKVKSVKSHWNKHNSTSSKDCSDQDVCLELIKENTSTTVDHVAEESSFSDEKLLEKEPFVLLERLNLEVPVEWEGTNNSEKSNGITTPTGNLKLPRSVNKKKRRLSDHPECSRKIKKRKKTHQAGTAVGKKNSKQNGTVSDDIHFSPSPMMSVVPCNTDSPTFGNFELNYSPLLKQAGTVFSNSVPPKNNGHFPYFFQNSSHVPIQKSRISNSDSSDDEMPLSLVSEWDRVKKTTPVKKTTKKLLKNTTRVVTQLTDFNVLCMPEIIHSNSWSFLSDLQKGSAIKNMKAQKKMVYSKVPESVSKVHNKKCKKPRPEKRNGNYFIKANSISDILTMSSRKPAPEMTGGHSSSSLMRIQLEHSYGIPCGKENAAKATKKKTSSVVLPKKKKNKCSCCQNQKKNSIQTLHALLNSYLQSFFIQFDKLSKKKNNLEKRDEALLRRKENVYKLILDEVHDHLKSTCRRAKKSSKKCKAQENNVQKEDLFTEDNFVSSQNRDINTEARENEDIKVEKEDLFTLNREDKFVSGGSSQNREINKEGKYRLGFLTQNKSLRLYHKCVAAERMFLSKYKMGKKQERKLKKFFQTLKVNSLSTS